LPSFEQVWDRHDFDAQNRNKFWNILFDSYPISHPTFEIALENKSPLFDLEKRSLTPFAVDSFYSRERINSFGTVTGFWTTSSDLLLSHCL
jgi:hypothetical protein